MHPKRLLLGGVLLAMVAAACGGTPAAPTGCFEPEGGTLVSVPCLETVTIYLDGQGAMDFALKLADEEHLFDVRVVAGGEGPVAPSTAEATVAPTLPPLVKCPTGGSPQALGCELFSSAPPQACSICHTIDGLAFGQIGPDLTHVGAKGETYIRESIANPNAVIADACPTGPCQPDVMPQDFGTALTADQLNAVVAFLLTLK